MLLELSEVTATRLHHYLAWALFIYENTSRSNLINSA